MTAEHKLVNATLDTSTNIWNVNCACGDVVAEVENANGEMTTIDFILIMAASMADHREEMDHE